MRYAAGCLVLLALLLGSWRAEAQNGEEEPPTPDGTDGPGDGPAMETGFAEVRETLDPGDGPEELLRVHDQVLATEQAIAGHGILRPFYRHGVRPDDIARAWFGVFGLERAGRRPAEGFMVLVLRLEEADVLERTARGLADFLALNATREGDRSYRVLRGEDGRSLAVVGRKADTPDGADRWLRLRLASLGYREDATEGSTWRALLAPAERVAGERLRVSEARAEREPEALAELPLLGEAAGAGADLGTVERAFRVAYVTPDEGEPAGSVLVLETAGGAAGTALRRTLLEVLRAGNRNVRVHAGAAADRLAIREVHPGSLPPAADRWIEARLESGGFDPGLAAPPDSPLWTWLDRFDAADAPVDLSVRRAAWAGSSSGLRDFPLGMDLARHGLVPASLDEAFFLVLEPTGEGDEVALLLLSFRDAESLAANREALDAFIADLEDGESDETYAVHRSTGEPDLAVLGRYAETPPAAASWLADRLADLGFSPE